MKKLMMLVAIVAAFASCQSNNKKSAEIVMENDSVVAIIPTPPGIEVDEEIFTGQRVFKMAPLHHHYQKEGIPALIKSPAKALPEAKIVSRFWIVGMILGVITIALLKVR